ncbi:MAG: hypothetical protein GY915_09645 [bacterium]|nr:hypothetical protein [bacterium]
MNVYALSTLEIGQDIVKNIQRNFPIKGVIGLSNRDKTDSISGFSYQKSFCENNNLDFIEVDSYALKNEEDKDRLLSLDIDVLVVCGWQRLIPGWLIEHCSIAALGSHGSPFGITKGRGRSPQNWALILGEEQFEISIFEIDEGIDSGNILDSRTFTYGPYDDIKTSYYKICLTVAEMVSHFLNDPKKTVASSKPQQTQEAEYLPQRKPEDGYIDWNRSPEELRRFVAALTHPYPGARTTVQNGKKVIIWNLFPFEIDIKGTFKVGEVIVSFNKKDLLVRVKDGFVLIDQYATSPLDKDEFKIQEGDTFHSVDFSQQMESVRERHNSRFPKLKLSSSIYNLGSKDS